MFFGAVLLLGYARLRLIPPLGMASIANSKLSGMTNMPKGKLSSMTREMRSTADDQEIPYLLIKLFFYICIFID